MEPWLILLTAFVMRALMILTHTYLGLHVLARGIIFIDLAPAQMTTLGMSLAFILGEEPHGLNAQLYAFGATVVSVLGLLPLIAATLGTCSRS